MITRRELVRKWNDGKADWKYLLNSYDEDGITVFTVSGDIDWAIRNAKHYGLKLPEEKTEK